MGNKACNPSKLFSWMPWVYGWPFCLLQQVNQTRNHVLSVSKLMKEGIRLAPHNLTSKYVIYRHFFWVLYFMAISVTREFIFWKMFVHWNPCVPHQHGVLCNIRKMWKQPKLKWRESQHFHGGIFWQWISNKIRIGTSKGFVISLSKIQESLRPGSLFPMEPAWVNPETIAADKNPVAREVWNEF